MASYTCRAVSIRQTLSHKTLIFIMFGVFNRDFTQRAQTHHIQLQSHLLKRARTHTHTDWVQMIRLILVAGINLTMQLLHVSALICHAIVKGILIIL